MPAPAPAPDPVIASAIAEAMSYGRVAEDGTVYVRLAPPVGPGEAAAEAPERAVGQYPEGTADEALAFFVRRFEALALDVQLLDRRIRSGAATGDEATTALRTLTTQVGEASAVGDLGVLTGRLEELAGVLEEARERRRAEKAQRQAEARAQKETVVAAAEKLAQGKDWRNGVNRLRDLLTEWKALPRLDRKSDDELWHRFSTARTAYTRRRKAHFAELGEQREEARGVKERLVKEAEKLADSTSWGPTAGEYRTLMQRWKDAGPAPKDVDDELWTRFRAAQDTFFGHRDRVNAELDAEFAVNAEKKQAILVEAEKLLPVRDLPAAKRAWRDIADRWEAAGKVPRSMMQELEARIRTVEQAIRGAEDDRWRKSDPEKSARADDLVSKLERSLADAEADLAKAREAGDQRKVGDLEATVSSRRSFLEMAQRTASEFSR